MSTALSSSTGMMRWTLLALTPGGLLVVWYFGAGIVFNIVVTSVVALATEALILRLRGKSITTLLDGSALLTGVLLGLALPPLLPFWMALVATVCALLFGKHLYGGLGHNLFNPAMVGFAILILSFPLAMSQWPPPSQASPAPSITFMTHLTKTIKAKWHTQAARADYDGITRATPLDAWRFQQALSSRDFFADPAQDANRQAWQYINLAFLLGGLGLLYLGVLPWQTPLSMLVVLGGLALVFHDDKASSLDALALHLLSGATMLAAFFIITDPVTCPSLPTGLLCFGAGVAGITFIIRTMGAYPEGIAFGVLLMNASSPLIDYLLAPHDRKSH